MNEQLTVSELKAIIKNFLNDAKTLTKEIEIKERISKLESDFKKINGEHVPGEAIANLKTFMSEQRQANRKGRIYNLKTK